MPIEWKGQTPAQLGDKIEKELPKRARVAVRALAKFIAGKMQDDMRASAPWEDRTGNARSGLFTVVEKQSLDVTIIWLSHGTSIDYGKWLEISNEGKYAVIMPTVQKWAPEIKRLLEELFK